MLVPVEVSVSEEPSNIMQYVAKSDKGSFGLLLSINDRILSDSYAISQIPGTFSSNKYIK